MKKPIRALPEVMKNLFTKPATRLYPFEKAVLFEGTRGRIVFEQPLCIGCKMCVRVCPAKAIDIIPHEPPIEGKRVFDCVMDVARCIYCAQCVDVCPKNALASSNDFEMAQVDKTKLIYRYDK